MASHENDHDHSDASRAGDEEVAEPVTTDQPGPDDAASGEARQEVDGPGDPAPGDAVEAVDAATNGAVDFVAQHPSDPAVDAPVDPLATDAVVPAGNGHADPVAFEPASIDPAGAPVDGPDDAVAPGRRAPGVGGERRRPATAARGGGGPATRRSGPPRNRRRPPGAGRATTSRPAAPPDPDEDRAGGRPDNRRGMVILLCVLSVVAVVLTIIAVNLGRSADRKAATTATTTATTRPAATLPDAAFTTFRDDETGFTMRYPTTWERLTVPLGEIRLFVTNRGAFSAQVRVQRTDQPTTPENLGNLRSFTDGSVAGEGVQVLKVDPVSINGLIGYRYLYTFVDSNSGIQGAHLHYFLFQGHKMNSIVFQALPTEEFTKAEGIFNQMLDSFRSDPEPAATSPPASTAPSPPGG